MRARYRAYSSSANLGPGFDVLAVALDAFHDDVVVTVKRGGESITTSFSTPGIDPENNTVRAAVEELLNMGGARPPLDIEIAVEKGVPVGRGLGSSGAAAAAAVRGVNEMLGLGLSPAQEILAAGRGEAAAAGTPHYDNVAASLLGGLAVVYRDAAGALRASSFNVDAWFVVAVPEVDTPPRKTGVMRSVLPEALSMEEHVVSAGRLAALVAGLIAGDYEAAGQGMEDNVVVPARKRFVPCYDEARDAALRAGALGFTLSGAGPSTIALASTRPRASRVASALERAYEACGLSASVRVSKPAPGAHRVL